MLGLTWGPLTLMEIRDSSMLIFISRRQQFECENNLMLFAFLPCAWVCEWCLDLCNSRQSLTSSPTADKESWNQQIPQHSSPKETCYEVTLFQSLWICLSRSQRKGPIWHNNTLWNNAMFRNNHKPSVAETKFNLLDTCICSDHPSDLSTATKSHSRCDQTNLSSVIH